MWLIFINILIILLFIILSINIKQREKIVITPSFNVNNYELLYIYISFVLLKNAWFQKIVLHVEVAEFLWLENPNFYRNGMIRIRDLFIENALRLLLDYPRNAHSLYLVRSETACR